MHPAAIVAAMEGAVRLGRRLHTVLVDATVERPLLLPLGSVLGEVTLSAAQEYFDVPEHRHLVAPGGPYEGMRGRDLLLAYRTLRELDHRLGSGGVAAASAGVEVVTQLHAFEQYRKGRGPRPALQRLAGSLFEVGVEFFGAHPEWLRPGSGERRLAEVVLRGVMEVNVAEGMPLTVLGEVFGSVLRVSLADARAVAGEEVLTGLAAGLGSALVKDLERFPEGMRLARERSLRRVAGCLVRVGVESGGWKEEDVTRGLVAAAAAEALAALTPEAALPEPAAVERLFASILTLTAQRPGPAGIGLVRTVLGAVRDGLGRVDGVAEGWLRSEADLGGALLELVAEHLDQAEAGSGAIGAAIRAVSALAGGPLRGRVTSVNGAEVVRMLVAAAWWDGVQLEELGRADGLVRAYLRRKAGLAETTRIGEAAGRRPVRRRSRRGRSGRRT